ncbi:Arc family DNA-binding protein [Paraburkholderia tropica]|uniref:Arc family DNA-binding protein n=1 Tax=Paraburkholderia tropica TaxID=92647 RepID=UPI002AAFF0BA|nr:Arc family DNA-binding protein [Paraburkholderia tropica]
MKGARQMPGVLVKMPPELKARIQAVAEERFRSMNAEIVRRLLESLENENAQPAATGQALVTQ